MSRVANEVDRHVGMRLRLRRKMLRLTQKRLAQSLGITLQQLSKYEIGSNRIGAGRLQAMADALDVQVSWFFEGGTLPGTMRAVLPKEALPDFGLPSDVLEFNGALMAITDPQLRKCIADLVSVLAQEE